MTSTAGRTEVSLHQARLDFGWLGRVIQVHSIGRFDVVEYHQKPASNDKDRNVYVSFGAYIDGEKTNRSYGSLEAAIVGSIAIAFDGINTRADGYFMRGIGADLPAALAATKTGGA